MSERGLNGQHRFDHELLDSAPQLACVGLLRAERVHDGRQQALVSLRSFLVSLRVLVDAVVCEVHGLVSEVASAGGVVRLGGESRESLAEEVNAQRVDARNEHVQAQVELALVDEKRARDVLLHDAAAAQPTVEVPLGAGEEDASSHGACIWLDYKHRRRLAVRVGDSRALPHDSHHLLKFRGPRGGDDQSLRREVKVARQCLFHSPDVPCKRSFSADFHHAREVVDALVRLKSHDAVRRHAQVGPEQVPERVGHLRGFDHAECRGDDVHDGVLALLEAYARRGRRSSRHE